MLNVKEWLKTREILPQFEPIGYNGNKKIKFVRRIKCKQMFYADVPYSIDESYLYYKITDFLEDFIHIQVTAIFVRTSGIQDKIEELIEINDLDKWIIDITKKGMQRNA